MVVKDRRDQKQIFEVGKSRQIQNESSFVAIKNEFSLVLGVQGVKGERILEYASEGNTINNGHC